MSTEMTTTEHHPLATLLADPDRLRDFPVETVERLFAMDREMRADSARAEFATAMNRVQGRIEPVRKTATNRQTASKYALAEDIERMLIPIITDEGFSVSASTTDPTIPDHIRYRMVVRHIGGHVEEHYLDAPIDDKGIKGNPSKTRLHGMGSAMTYCRRYLLCQIFNVNLVEDTDGNRPTDDRSITDKQAADLSALINEVGADRAKFLKYFRIESVDDLPEHAYNSAIRMLEAKR